MPALISKLTVVICLFAALIETVLGVTSTAGLGLADSVIVLFIVGPYGLLGVFAWRYHQHRTVSSVLLVAAILLASWGLVVSGVNSYRYHTEPDYRLVQSFDIFFAALARWAIVIAIGLGLLMLRLFAQRNVSRSL